MKERFRNTTSITKPRTQAVRIDVSRLLPEGYTLIADSEVSGEVVYIPSHTLEPIVLTEQPDWLSVVDEEGV